MSELEKKKREIVLSRANVLNSAENMYRKPIVLLNCILLCNQKFTPKRKKKVRERDREKE